MAEIKRADVSGSSSTKATEIADVEAAFIDIV
jgi:hypothetical protein